MLGLDPLERGDSLYYAARDSADAWLARGSFKIDAQARQLRAPPGLGGPGTDSLHVHMINVRLGVRYRADE